MTEGSMVQRACDAALMAHSAVTGPGGLAAAEGLVGSLYAERLAVEVPPGVAVEMRRGGYVADMLRQGVDATAAAAGGVVMELTVTLALALDRLAVLSGSTVENAANALIRSLEAEQ